MVAQLDRPVGDAAAGFDGSVNDDADAEFDGDAADASDGGDVGNKQPLVWFGAPNFFRSPPGHPDCKPTDNVFRWICDPYPFSKVSPGEGNQAGWRLAGNALAPPIVEDGIGPDGGDAWLDAVQLTFEYAGASPRVGRLVAMLPTSGTNPGSPPTSDADALLGKPADQYAYLSASYLVGGDDIWVALVDVDGSFSQELSVAQYRNDSCRYGCGLTVPLSDLTQGSRIDLHRIRYVAFIVDGDPPEASPSMTIGEIAFDNGEPFSPL